MTATPLKALVAVVLVLSGCPYYSRQLGRWVSAEEAAAELNRPAERTTPETPPTPPPDPCPPRRIVRPTDDGTCEGMAKAQADYCEASVDAGIDRLVCQMRRLRLIGATSGVHGRVTLEIAERELDRVPHLYQVEMEACARRYQREMADCALKRAPTKR